jgi:hypothetical protein
MKRLTKAASAWSTSKCSPFSNGRWTREGHEAIRLLGQRAADRSRNQDITAGVEMVLRIRRFCARNCEVDLICAPQ